MAKGYNVDGFTELHLVEVGTWKELPAPKTLRGAISGVSFSRDGTKIAFTLSAPTLPADVWTYHLATGELRQVTHSTLAGIPIESFQSPSVVRFRSFDGLEIPGLLFLPSGAKKGDRLPTIINVHGGPESQASVAFAKATQYYLHRGYAVYHPNVRGSTGYGRTFMHLDDVRKRMDSVRDLAEAARWLEREGYSDSDRIAVMGGSYGGFMTLAALTTYPDMWAAGIDIVGIANFVSFLENTGAYRRHLRISEYGDPEKDLDFLKSISPLTHADKIVAPLMVIQGANDPRVPRSEAEQIVAAVKARGGSVEYLLFEDEGHGVSKIPNQIKAYTRVGDFLDANLGPRIATKKE
jgi:dipeptidyl aminopeptidase/acylaminoacyl peptidase